MMMLGRGVAVGGCCAALGAVPAGRCWVRVARYEAVQLSYIARAMIAPSIAKQSAKHGTAATVLRAPFFLSSYRYLYAT